MKTDEGNFSQLKIWKLKQKICPKIPDPPMAKKDENGSLITAPELLKSLYLRTYEKRLENRIMKKELMDVYFLKQELRKSRMVELRSKKSEAWDKKHLKQAIKSLKNNKTTDPNGMINELLKEGCIGTDLEDALLELFNGIKETFYIPEFLAKQNISSIFKNKGSRLEMNNERGIFILTALKKILDKLIYVEKYDGIDKNMSDSNIGARRGRNIKNHLFIIYGIINSVVKGTESCIDLQIYDLEKAFDALWLEDCMNDLYDTIEEEERDEKIALLYKSNEENLVAVNTAVGITNRINMPTIVQQGGTWGPCLCSNTVDQIGKKIRDRGETAYLYKNTVGVLPLAMVDDINAISKCGLDSINLNTYINTQIELKKLRFHVPDKSGKTKCHKMHIGKNKKHCPELKVHGTTMESVTENTYLGDIISCDGKNTKNVDKRVSKGIGIITQIMNILEILSFGPFYTEIALLLRESLFINGILYNAEVWYGLTRTEINKLEELDRHLLRRILTAPISTPKEALYLELGIIPIEIIIKARRINYFYYLLNRDKNEMINKFFMTQWLNPTRGDWTETLKQDLLDFGMPEDFQYYKSKSKFIIKNEVKRNSKQYALKILSKQKKCHKKMNNLEYKELKTQNYFFINGLKIEEIQNVFKFRTRMTKIGGNYKGKEGVNKCPLCDEHMDVQEMLINCEPLRNKLEVDDTKDISDIYSEEVTLESARIVSKLQEIRKKLLETKD